MISSAPAPLWVRSDAAVPLPRVAGFPVSQRVEKTGFSFNGFLGDSLLPGISTSALVAEKPPFNDCGSFGAGGYPGTVIDGTGRAKQSGKRLDRPAQSPIFALFLMVAPLIVVVTVGLFLSF